MGSSTSRTTTRSASSTPSVTMSRRGVRPILCQRRVVGCEVMRSNTDKSRANPRPKDDADLALAWLPAGNVARSTVSRLACDRARPPTDEGGKNMPRVLVVDDDLDLVEACRLVLEDAGYTVEAI